MFLVRPVELTDIPALEALAPLATQGVHTLARTREAIGTAVERSLASFAAQVDGPGEEAYLFVLVDGADDTLAGSAAISALAGSNGMFFAFRNDVIQQVSRDLHIRHSVHALTMCSDLTGYSQLSSFFVRDWRRAGAEAALLSRARMMYAAGAPHRFSDRFFASLAGITDRDGRSPFWEALGRKFFQMDFLAAERAIEGTRNRTLLVEVMPHYPVYVPLLPDEAKAVMGQVHIEGELPLALLTGEGFGPDEFIDIFDGGAILQAHKMALRAFNASLPRRVADPCAGAKGIKQPYLVSTVGQREFRAIVVESGALDMQEHVALPAEAQRALGVIPGDLVLAVPM